MPWDAGRCRCRGGGRCAAAFARSGLLGLRKPAAEIAWRPLAPGAARPGRADILVLPVIAWTIAASARSSSPRPSRPADAASSTARSADRTSPRSPWERRRESRCCRSPTCAARTSGDRRLDRPRARCGARGPRALRASASAPQEVALLVQIAVLGAPRGRGEGALRLAASSTTASTPTTSSPTNRPRVLADAERGWRARPTSSSRPRSRFAGRWQRMEGRPPLSCPTPATTSSSATCPPGAGRRSA